jgi:hypothetical protein
MKKELISLDPIAKLLNIIGRTYEVDSFFIRDSGRNNLKYTILKEGDSIIISSSDGRKLKVSTIFKYGENDGYFSSFSIPSTDISIEYALVNNASVTFNGSISNRTDYDALQTVTPTVLKSITTPELITGRRHTKFTWEGIPEGAKIDDESITLGAYKVDRQGKEILAINDEKVPSYKSIETFNYEEEKAKIENFINSKENNLNGVTIQAIEQALVYLEQKAKYLSKTKHDYEVILNRVNDLIDDRFAFLNGLRYGTFSTEELNRIIIGIERYLSEVEKLTELSFTK